MKLSELHPCDNCGGPVAPIFHIIKVVPAVIKARAANEVLGLFQMFQGQSLMLAEVMAPNPDGAVQEAPELAVTLFLCTPCYCERLSLAELTERQTTKVEKNEL